MNPTNLTNDIKPISFQSGSVLPQVGTEAYRQAQQGISPIGFSGLSSNSTAPIITSASLGTSPTPIPLTSPAPTTGLVGLQGTIESGVTSSVADLQRQEQARAEQAKIDSQKATVDTNRKSFLDTLLGRKGEATLTSEEYSRVNELGTTVNQTADAVRKANQEILNEQYAARKREEQLRNTFQGSPTGLNDALEKERRESTSKQADLYIKKLALQGDYDSAKSIADQLVNARYEKQQNEIDAARLTYEDSKEIFTKAEQRQFEATWDAKQRELDRKKEEEKVLRTTDIDLQKSMAENNAPQYIKDAVSRATTADAKIQAAGVYGTDMISRKIKEQQLLNLGMDFMTAQAKLSEASDVNEVTPYQKEKQVRIINSVDSLANRVNPQTVGIASLARFVPGSIQRNFANDLNTLKANIAFGELTAMREASKTGGALGQVSNIELGLLESSLAGLDQGQSPANFRKNLQQIKDSITRWQNVASKVSEEDKLRAAGYSEEQIQQIKLAK